MVTVSEIQTEAEFEEVAPKKPWSKIAIDLCRKQPLGVFGLAIVIAMIIAAALANVVSPYDPL